MKGPIQTRPERTPEEIETDRAEGETFFTTVFTGDNGPRDLERLIRYHSHAEHLVQCTLEGDSWWRSHQPSTAQRRLTAARNAARQAPIASELRAYLDDDTRAALPPASIHQREAKERVRDWGKRHRWLLRLERIPADRLPGVVDQDRTGYAHWMLSADCDYPARAGSNEPRKTRKSAIGAYKRGDVRPAGMTPERAFEIAARALARPRA